MARNVRRLIAGGVLAGAGALLIVARRRNRSQRHRLTHLYQHALHPRPPEDVGDDVVEARVRTALGRTTRRLRIPHVHVTVYEHVAYLHGIAHSMAEERDIVHQVRGVSGVRRVRPRFSIEPDGHAAPPAAIATSAALRHLRDSLGAEWLSDDEEDALLRGTLSCFLGLVPESTRMHIASHLPADVRDGVLAQIPELSHRQRHDIDELATLIADRSGVTHAVAARALADVCAALSDIIPEERDDVTAVLPQPVRPLWLRERTPAR